MDPGTGGLSVSGRNAGGDSRVAVQPKDLEEWIFGVTFTLKNQLAPVGTEISFSGTTALERELTYFGQECGFLDSDGFGVRF